MNAITPEIFKPVPGFPAYQVSNTGRVQSNFKGSWNDLKPAPGSIYLGVILCRNKQHFARRVHVLVALAFLPPKPPGKICVRHLDGNHLNNHAVNLAWGTHSQNMQDRPVTAMYRRPVFKKLSSPQIYVIRVQAMAGRPHIRIAQQFGVHVRTIQDFLSQPQS